MQVGFDALFFGRADYDDMRKRTAAKELEMVWRGSPNSELDSNVFAGNFASGNYGEGICKLGIFSPAMLVQ